MRAWPLSLKLGIALLICGTLILLVPAPLW